MVAETPFHLSDAWFDTWRQAYCPRGAEPCRIGGVPMLAETARLGPIPYRRLKTQTNAHSLRCDADPAADGAALLMQDADIVTIDYVPEDARLLALARGWGSRVVIAPHALSPVADCRESYDRWFARRSRRSRHRWRTLEREVFDTRGFHFVLHDGRSDLDALLAQMFAVEQSGWKGRERSAILDSPVDTRFYTLLAQRAADVGALRLALLYDGDGLVAFEYGIRSGDRVFLLKVGYDERFEELSIGHVLAMRNIRDCCEDPALAWYDKLGNGMTPAPYKLRFSDQLDPLYRITHYAPTWRGALLRAEADARARAKIARDQWRERRAA